MQQDNGGGKVICVSKYKEINRKYNLSGMQIISNATCIKFKKYQMQHVSNANFIKCNMYVPVNKVVFPYL